MIVALFFLIGAFLLTAFDPNVLALSWASFPHPVFFLNVITHMFAHANWAHLMGNYMYVLPYALYLEYRIGQARFVRFWLLCGLSALALQASTLFFMGSNGVIGSSGAAFGIVAAALCMVDYSSFTKWFCRTVVAYHVFNQAFLAYLMVASPFFRFFSNVAFAAHLGGVLCGIALAALELRRERRST